MIVKPSAGVVALSRSPIATHQADVPTFERPMQKSTHFSARQDQIVPLDLDGYQIACLPFPASEEGSSLQNSGRNQLFLVPLTWNQLITRVRRETVHTITTNESHIVRFGQVRIDLLAMEVCRSDRPVSLTAMEFKVLKFFVSNPNRVISRDDLLNQVWGYDNYPCTRTVDNQILKLRHKLETEAGRPVHFRTVHGVGYKFVP
jgi:DNA-binding winged helix-turn-helix (wHTH) protein